MMSYATCRAVVLALVLALPITAQAGISIHQLTSANNETFNVYVSGPKEADTAVILVHDWFGVSPFFTESVSRLGLLGYRVIGVDLYDGRSATAHRDAGRLMGSVDVASANAKIDAAIAAAGRSGRRIAVMGFSMGTVFAMRAAIRHSDMVKATVVFYGGTVNDTDLLGQIGGPVLAVYGSKDGNAADAAATFSKAADEAGAAAEVFIYPGAAHAFAQPLFNGGKTYDPVATRVAWLLTEDFLRRQLRGG